MNDKIGYVLKTLIKYFTFHNNANVICLSTILAASFFSSSTWAAERFVPLLPDQAFVFSTSINQKNIVRLSWQIAPSYYLYAKRINITASAAQVKFSLPSGVIKRELNQEDHEVYAGELIVPVQLTAASSTVPLTVSYQGCSQNGFCYPPLKKQLQVNLVNHTLTETAPLSKSVSSKSVISKTVITKTSGENTNGVSTAKENITSSKINGTFLHSLISNQHQVENIFQQHHSTWLLLLIFTGLGVLLAFTPCILPMVPILAAIIAGQQQRPGTRRAFFLSATYVLGMSISYALAGLVAASLGRSLQSWLQTPFFIILGSVFFVMLALSIFEFYDTLFIRHWQKRMAAWNKQYHGGNYTNVFLMGIVSTLVVSPCVTAPLVGVLIYIGNTGDLLFGASALFMMGLGMGIPLLLIGTAAARCLPKSGPWMAAIKAVFGFLMLAMAVWLLSRIVSPVVSLLLWGVLSCSVAFFFAGHLPRVIGFPKINRSLGTAAGICGIWLIAGVMLPNTMSSNIIGPFKLVSASTVEDPAFIRVHNMAEIKQHLAQALVDKRGVLLDFYADWCESCLIMDRTVFKRDTVQRALHPFVLLRVDLSQNTAADEEMMKYFKVIAPPTVLFIDHSGQEVNESRIVGEVSAADFLDRLNLAVTASCDKKISC